MSRVPVLAANWKMNHLRSDTAHYAEVLSTALAPEPAASQIVIFPPATVLHHLSRSLEDAPVETGGQDVHPEASGAHTGDLSAAMLLDAGATWALCGHSERRQNHHESDSWIAGKVEASLSAGLRVMLCLGETLEEREAGETEGVLSRQLATGLPKKLDEARMAKLAVAYEPVWAIGTGRNASPEIAQTAHAFLRQHFAELNGEVGAESLRLLYGGSVKPENCEALFRQPDVDGFLIGGAGLDPERFLDIIRRCDA